MKKHSCKSPVFDIMTVLDDECSQSICRCIFCGELHILDSKEREQYNEKTDNKRKG